MKKIKIFFNEPLKETPYGGAAHFVSNFVNYLKEEFEITFELEKDIDLIIFVSNSTYKYKEKTLRVLKYKKKNPKTKVIQRINDCDKRKNTNQVDKLILKTNKIADETVFISNWLAEYFIAKGFNRPYQVIYNGCNSDFFYPNKEKKFGDTINLVTHHWSNNWLKGFDIYTEFDKILETKKDLTFTYIGRYYDNYKPINTKIVPPLYGKELGDELRKYDIYLTASRWEPCGMHHIEGASCGLPILYHKYGGGINESCRNYGIEYHDIPSLLDVLNGIKKNYQGYRNKIPYKFLSSKRCNDEYYHVIKEMFNL